MNRLLAIALAAAGIGICAATTAIAGWMIFMGQLDLAASVWIVGMLAGILFIARAESVGPDRAEDGA